MDRLTKKPDEKTDMLLTDRNSSQFIISFKYKLENNYNFKSLSKDDNRRFQHFLDKICGMTVNDVDKKYRRPPDKSDIFNGQQVQHYEIDKDFRIHGINEKGRFKVLRLDPHHSVHKG